MALGINSSKRRLDDPGIQEAGDGRSAFEDWYKAFSTDQPSFAGRYFLGGRFKKINQEETDCVVQWSPGEFTALSIPEPITNIVPIQAGIKARQELTGKVGREAGAIDAKRFCENIKSACTLKDLKRTKQSFYVFLEVESGTTLSLDYWNAWAIYVKKFSLSFNPDEGTGLFDHPFFPCILCDFEWNTDENLLAPATAATQCLNTLGLGYKYPQCYGFWARAEPDTTPDAPVRIDNETFSLFKPITGNYSIPVLFWQFATAPDSDKALLGWNLSISNENLNLINCTLPVSVDGWDPNVNPAKYVGIDISQNIEPNIDDIEKISLIERKQVDPELQIPSGVDKITYAGRYYGPAGLKKLLTDSECIAISKKDFKIISVWEGDRSGYRNDWSPYGALYFAQGFKFGRLDAIDACSAAQKMNQAERTPVYFGIDYDPDSEKIFVRESSTPPVEDVDYDSATEEAVDYGRGEIKTWIIVKKQLPASEIAKRHDDILNYFKGIAAGYAEFLEGADSKYYDIGVYATDTVLKNLYDQGIVNYFWHLKFNASTHSYYEHANIVQVNKQEILDGTWDVNSSHFLPLTDFDISWGVEGTWNTKPEYYNP